MFAKVRTYHHVSYIYSELEVIYLLYNIVIFEAQLYNTEWKQLTILYNSGSSGSASNHTLGTFREQYGQKQ